MIWYLLYPFRGTTEAPVLPPAHPLRITCTRYGRYAARHVVTTLLISVAVAAILIYPFPFLYTTDVTNGASNLPHHVWTVAQPLEYNATIEPDVIMRSIWVHGSHMKALERDLLLGALDLQDQLLGPTENFNPRRPVRGAALQDPLAADLSPDDRDAFHVINGLTNQSWFFHSPLQYWGCSTDRITADQDIISTVNEKKTQPTSVNVTLRHSIVFSGKTFEDRSLVAADALVITLIHMRDSPVGRQWERRAGALAARMADKWTAYPADGLSMPSELYEFQFRPISTQDSIILALAYGLASTYFVVSLSKLRAVKSKLGLIVTVVVQVIVSVLSSFTVCAIFKIDLSRIPQAAYPVVVLSMSLENVFRLINAVIAMPSEDSTSSRIGSAFGETAHIALASSTQNVLILWGLSKVVSPGVAAFCTFAAVAIVFDFFYLSTFFLSVLSVDVRRTELSDALAKASIRENRRATEPRAGQNWTEVLLQGKLAMSTRIAGTIIMVGFVLVAQWHFFENQTVIRALGRFFNVSREVAIEQPKNSLLVGIHQARSPTSWLRMQDHDTAREVIKIIKPSAYSYIAKVYDPLVFVRKGSDRIPHESERAFLPAAYDFIHHHLTPFVVTVLVILAAVRLLMNYLLWEDESESKQDEDSHEEPLLTVKSLRGGHVLDVALLCASTNYHIVSVAYDRGIRVWDARSGTKSYSLTDMAKPPEDPFPILSLAIDDESNWLALLSPYRVLLWDLTERKWGPSRPVDLYGQKPEAFFFGSSKTVFMYPLIIIRRNGTLTQLSPSVGESADYVLCKSPLVSAMPLLSKSSTTQPTRSIIVTASRKGCIHVAAQNENETDWASLSLDLHSTEDRDAYQVLPLGSLESFLIVRSRSVDLVDARDNRLIHTFETERILPRSLKCFHSSHTRTQFGSTGIGSFSLVYTSAESDHCVIQTHLPREEGETIFFQNDGMPPSRNFCSWSDTRQVKKRIKNPGTWEALPSGCVVGVRKGTADGGISSGESSPVQAQPGLRRRLSSKPDGGRGGQDSWEVWIAGHFGRQDIYETKPLHSDEEDGGHLIISQLGPMVKVGAASVVVGFGNLVKLITVGHGRFGDPSSGQGGDAVPEIGSRRRKPGLSRSRPRNLQWG